MKRSFCPQVTKVLLPSVALAALMSISQAVAQTFSAQPEPAATAGKAALPVYRDLLNPVFDPADVHQIRGIAIDREDLHITLTDGTIALMKAIDGHVTGAIFEGNGEILLLPPDRAERTSLALFTQSAVLDQKFTSAYFRFVDDKLAAGLRAGFRPTEKEDAEEFIGRWAEGLKPLAREDSLQVLQAMLNSGSAASSRFLHMRAAGSTLGVFDVYYDTSAQEQITVGQAVKERDTLYYDHWASFAMRTVRESRKNSDVEPRFALSDYRLRASIDPPNQVSMQAEFTLTPHVDGARMVIMELSQFLQMSSARLNGQALEIIQNEPLGGSELSRRGDDLVGLVFPTGLEKGRPVKIECAYSGTAIFNAGPDLLYVGSRGTWYPNVGPAYSNFDLTFDYPDGWTLVATGKQTSSTVANGRRTSRFVSEKPMAHAGFNLGKFDSASASVGGVAIRAYAARTVESSLALAAARAGKNPDPALEVKQIATQAANTVQFLSDELDPFPYSKLEITQLPALLSQSWPGLIYLSSMAFLTPDERHALGINDPYKELLLSRLMLAHEAAHQWWGDAVDWASYRDEWITEALANYSALLMLEKNRPEDMKAALDNYKFALLRKGANGMLGDAGAVTLGPRLNSSKFPDAYEPVLYGRGTWICHMLRSMLRQASGQNNDALFFAALKDLLARSPNDKISTHDLQLAFEKVMPASLGYEGKSLDWFFDSWGNGTSIPQFELENVHVAKAASGVKVTGSVRESYAAKDMVTAVPIYAVDEAGKQKFLAFVFADDAKVDFSLNAPEGTRQVVLDPEGTVLRR